MKGAALRHGRRAFRCTECAFQPVKTSQHQQRSFTYSSPRLRHGAIPDFTNVSSPELAQKLKAFRENTILPAHLSNQQRALIYKRKNWKTLETEEGVVARIAGEEFTLKPIDRTKDLIDARELLCDAVKLFNTQEDWDNLPRLLAALKNAKVQLKPKLFIKIVQDAAKAGKENTIHECIRQHEETGFPVTNWQVIQQVVWWNQKLAVDNGFGQKVTERALKWSEATIAELEKQLNDSPTNTPAPLSKAVVMGIRLQLAAVRALKFSQDQDYKGTLEKYAQLLLQTFKSTSLDGDSGKNARLLAMVPVVHGIKVALKVLPSDSPTAQALAEKVKPLESELSESYQSVLQHAKEGDQRKDPKMFLGPSLYEKLIVGDTV